MSSPSVREQQTRGVWSVPRDWPGATVVCLATGPSLTQADVDLVRGGGRRVIAINDAYRLAPWADVLYACDGSWWQAHDGVPGFRGMKISTTKNAKQWGLCVELGADEGLSLDPTTLCHGGNSGYQAVNLAVLFGAARILLLGYDCKPDPEGKTHFFGVHRHNPVAPPFAIFAMHWPSIVAPLRAAGVEIWNCTRSTALTCFPRVSLEEALAWM